MGKTYEIYFIKDLSPTKNNVYLVVDKESKRTAIIDAACRMEQIDETVKKYGLIIDMILVTHTHFDHIRRIDDIVEKYDCKVYVSRLEARYYSFRCNNIQLFDDNASIALGNTWIKCILTPGHTVGSSCFLLENSLFSGDTIFMEGCGLCNASGGSAISMFHSIKKVKRLVDESVLVYPGHTYTIMPGKSLQYLKNNNIYFAFEEEEKFVAFRMRENQRNLFRFT